MKFPIVFRVLASLNIIIFILLLFQTIGLYMAPIFNFDVSAISFAVTIWTLLVAFYWFFASNKSYSFLYLAAIMFLILAVYVIYSGYRFFDPRDLEDSLPFLIAYSIIWVVYSAFMFASLFFKPVVEWKKQVAQPSWLPHVLFVAVLGGSILGFLAIDKLDKKYIVLGTAEYPTRESSGIFFLKFEHLNTFDGLAIIKTDDEEELTANVYYSESWTPVANEDYFKVEKLTFKKISRNKLYQHENIPYWEYDNEKKVSLYASFPEVKARTVKIELLDGKSFGSSSYTFTALHSVNHFGRSEIMKEDLIAFDDWEPVEECDCEGEYLEGDSGDPYYEGDGSYLEFTAQNRNDFINNFINLLIVDYNNSQYDFNSSNSRIVLGGKSFGLYDGFHYYFYQNWHRMWDTGYVRETYEETRDLNRLNQSVQELTGVPLFYGDEELTFRSLNPKFVEWIKYYLLPSADDKFYNYTARQIYHAIFRRAVWMLMASHEYLVPNDGDDTYLEQAAREYLEASREQEFYGPGYLIDNHASFNVQNNPTYAKIWQEIPNLDKDYFYFENYVAIGFWFRRKLDGSSDAVWDLLQTIVERYDNYPYDAEGGD